MKKIFASLNEGENLVNVLLDEIHVKKCIAYKDGHLHSTSENSTEVATTIKVFMITSLAIHKHVIALFPVGKLTAGTLLQQTQRIIKVCI